MAQEIIEETGKEVAKFMAEFAKFYVAAIVSSKIDGLIEEVVGAVVPSTEEEDGNEEKALEDKDDSKPVAAGVRLVSYKYGIGPDRIEHRYYDCATFVIKPKDSVIGRCTYSHRRLMNFASEIKKKIEGCPDVPFPQKKRLGKKDIAFYRNRMEQMISYYNVMSSNPKVSLSDPWLVFFQLKYDEAAAGRKEVFLNALQATCEANGIDWNDAERRASRLGFDLDEVEMLKSVAVTKVGQIASAKIREQVQQSAPNFLPSKVKHNFVDKADKQLASVISQAVELGWNGAKEVVAKVHDSISGALDKAADPLKEILGKIVTPVGDLVKEKFSELDEKTQVEDGLGDVLETFKASRFPNVSLALAELEKGESVAQSCRKLMNSVCDLRYNHRYVPYLRYQFAENEIVQYIPFVNDMCDNHNRLVIALVDAAYVLGRATCRAFEPLCEYVDKASSAFNAEKHEASVYEAVLAGGGRLSVDYFSVPHVLRWSCWYCGHEATDKVISFGKVTVNSIADFLGTVVTAWKPTGAEDAKSTFAAALKPALDAFVADRVLAILNLIRDTACDMISDLFYNQAGDVLDKLCEIINELFAALPPPLNELKPGTMIETIVNRLVSAATTTIVKKWAAPTEKYLLDPEAAAPTEDITEELVSKFRVHPVVRNDGDDTGEPEKDPYSESEKATVVGDADAPENEEAKTDE